MKHDDEYQGEDNQQRDELCGSRHLVDRVVRAKAVPLDRELDGYQQGDGHAEAEQGLELAEEGEADVAKKKAFLSVLR